jgi:hypothetical protein
MAQKRIIFIHGLRGPGADPLPSEQECLQEWRDALRNSLWVDIPDHAFQMAYWANYKTPAGVKEPGATRLRWSIRVREVRSAYRPDKLLRWTRGLAVQFLFDLYCRLLRRAGPLLCALEKQWLTDYWVYFNVDGAREQIRGVLEEELDSAAQAGERVAVVAHSMGTVIALDALYHRGDREDQKDTASQNKHGVDLFVTMGSPLGLTPFQIDLTKSPVNPKGYAHPHFPGNVRHWLNVFDGMDKATLLDRRLGNDFTYNNMDRIVDRMIRANVGPKGERDPHHWYGYLSCEEVGDAVSKFWVAP